MILLEIAWVLVICTFIPLYQLSSGTGLEELRIELILLAFHATAIMAVIGLLEAHSNVWPIVVIFWLIFTVFTDLWSVLQVWLHTAQVPGIEQSFLNGIKSMSIIGICFSGLTVIAYAIVLMRQGMDNFKSERAVKKFKNFVDTDAKINHKIQV
jgi:hypothetical protein